MNYNDVDIKTMIMMLITRIMIIMSKIIIMKRNHFMKSKINHANNLVSMMIMMKTMITLMRFIIILPIINNNYMTNDIMVEANLIIKFYIHYKYSQ